MSLFSFAFSGFFLSVFFIIFILVCLFLYTNWRFTTQEADILSLYNYTQEIESKYNYLEQTQTHIINTLSNLNPNLKHDPTKEINLTNHLIEVPFPYEEEEEEDEDEDEDDDEEDEDELDEDDDELEDVEVDVEDVDLEDVNEVDVKEDVEGGAGGEIKAVKEVKIELDKKIEDDVEEIEEALLDLEIDPAPSIKEPKPVSIDFKKYSVSELREYATKKNIPQANKLSKKDLIKILST
jgi:hypothetical protein